MAREQEIGLLKGLVQTVCQSADLCAAARQVAPDEDWAGLLDRLRADHGNLLRDLLGCLMLRDLSAREVRSLVMDTVPSALEVEDDFDLLQNNLERAEHDLEDALRHLLAEDAVRGAELDLLSLHYLKVPLRLRDIEAMQERSFLPVPETAASCH